MKWEYKHIVTDTYSEGVALLNGMGEEGWELIIALKTEREHSMLILKRPKIEAGGGDEQTVKFPGPKS